MQKGYGRPVFNERERTTMLSSLRVVDKVVVTTTIEWWEKHRRAFTPHAYVRGDEGTTPPEIEFFSSLGTKIVFIPKLPGYSTTRMLERIKA